MGRIVYVTEAFAVTGALTAEDFAHARAAGFASVLSNRPDGEEPGQLSAAEEAALAAAVGLAFAHVPARAAAIFSADVIGPMRAALADLPGPVLAHCKSGQRSALAWAAARAGDAGVDAVLAQTAVAGFNFAAMRDELAAVRT